MYLFWTSIIINDYFATQSQSVRTIIDMFLYTHAMRNKAHTQNDKNVLYKLNKLRFYLDHVLKEVNRASRHTCTIPKLCLLFVAIERSNSVAVTVHLSKWIVPSVCGGYGHAVNDSDMEICIVSCGWFARFSANLLDGSLLADRNHQSLALNCWSSANFW